MNLNQIEKKKRYQKQKRIIEEAKTEAIENMQKRRLKQEWRKFA